MGDEGKEPFSQVVADRSFAQTRFIEEKSRGVLGGGLKKTVLHEPTNALEGRKERCEGEMEQRFVYFFRILIELFLANRPLFRIGMPTTRDRWHVRVSRSTSRTYSSLLWD